MGKPSSSSRLGDYRETADGNLAVFKIPKPNNQGRRRSLATDIQYVVTKLPNLGSVYRLILPGMDPRIILVDRNQDSEREITKIAGLDSVPITSSDFLHETEQAIRTGNPSATNYHTSVLLEQNGVKIIKFGRFLMGFNEQLCGLYDPEINAWKLQAVWDGEKPDIYYRVNHPAAEAIIISHEPGKGRYCSRKKLVYLQSLVDGACGAFSIDPVVASGPESGFAELEGPGIPCRLYFQKEGEDLFAFTSNFVFKFDETISGFSAVMSLTNGNGSVALEPNQHQEIRALGPSCVLV